LCRKDSANAGRECETKDDFAAAAKVWAGKLAIVEELIKATKQAGTDITARKTSMQKREAKQTAEDRKQHDKLLKKFELEEKKKTEKAGKAAAEAAKSRARPGHTDLGSLVAWSIFTLELKHLAKIPTCVASEFRREDFDWESPCCVTKVDSAFFDSCKEATAVTTAWKLGFDNSVPVKQKGKSNWQLPQEEKLRAGLLQYGPEDALLVDSLGNKSYDSAMMSVHVWGYALTCRNSGTEPHSLASLKYQLSGKRLVIVCSILDVVKYLQEEAEPEIQKPTTTDVTNAFKFATQPVVDALRARGAKIFHTIVEPRSILWVPVGYWIIEKPIGVEVNFGVRTAALCKACL
jgi:hypothetical protein